MIEENFHKVIAERRLQEKADQLFACCLQFLIAREETLLVTIRDLSQQLLNEGYETSFEHRRKALVVRSMFSKLNELTEQRKQYELDQVGPRKLDLEGLPDAS